MRVVVDGAELFCSTAGEGPVCLVLCSIGTAPSERQTQPQLTRRFRLAYVDLRGGGRSSGDPADLTFDVLASDLEAVRRALGVARVVVLGHSILGALAIEYARRCPERVSHAVLVGTPPTGDMRTVAARAASFFESDASDERKQVSRERLAALPPGATLAQAFAAQAPMRFFDPRTDMAPLFAGADVKPRLLQHVMGPLTATWDITADVASLRVPILIAHGRYDYTVPHTLWQDVWQRLPTAAWRLFERSGHQPFLEEPELFADMLQSWMS